MEEQKRLTLEVTYPLIALLSLVIIDMSIYLQFATIAIILMYIKLLLFVNEKFDLNTIKKLGVAFLIIIMAGISFHSLASILPFNYISPLNIGLVFGTILSLVIANFILKTGGIRPIKYNFEDSKNKFNVTKLLDIWLYFAWIFFGLLILIDWIVKIPEYLTFIIIFTSTFFYLKRYNLIPKNWQKLHLNKHHYGGILCIISPVLTVYQSWIGLLSLLVGVTLIQHYTVNGSFRKAVVHKFFYPSLGVILTSWLLLIATNDSLGGLDKYLLPIPALQEIKIIEEKEKEINLQMNEYFREREKTDVLFQKITPRVKLDFVHSRTWDLRRKVDLIAEYTYDAYVDTLHYYRLAKYQLNNSAISEAMVQTFKTSIEKFLNQYLELNTRVEVLLDGAADAIPFDESRFTPYRGEYGPIVTENVDDIANNRRIQLQVVEGKQLDNPQLALLRAYGIKDYLKDISLLQKNKPEFKYRILVEPEKRGAKHRKVAIRLKIEDIYQNI